MLAAQQRTRQTLSEAVISQHTWLRQAMIVVAGSIFIALSARASIALPIGPVPISGLTFGVLLAGALLGPRLGASAAILYLAEGIVGLPVFAGGASGWAIITGSTGGFLLAAPLAAMLVGWLVRHGWDRRPWTLAVAMFFGDLVFYALGLPLLYLWGANHPELIQTDMTWNLTLQWGLIPFIPGDAAKILLAASLVPLGWQALNAAHVGPGRALRGEQPASMNLTLLGISAGIAMALAAFLPWAGETGIASGAGWAVLAAGLASVLGIGLRMRGALNTAVAQLWVFVTAAVGGLVAFVHVVTFTEAGVMTLADAAVGPIVASLAALVLVAFAISEAAHEERPRA